MNELVATREFLIKKLAEVNEQILKLEKAPIEEMRLRLADLSDRPEWKAYAMKQGGVVDNMISILDLCYDELIEYIHDNYSHVTYFYSDIIGHQNSREWSNFQFRVMMRHMNPSEFDNEDVANSNVHKRSLRESTFEEIAKYVERRAG